MSWMEWVGRKVFLRLRTGQVYTGKIISVDSSSEPLVFIQIKDKYDKLVTFVHSEVIEIREERY